MKTILAAVDLSESSSRVVDTAISLAAAFRADLFFVHVINFSPPIAEYYIPVFGAERDFDGERNRALEVLRGYALQAERVGVNSEIEVREGTESRTLLTRARELSADLIVLGHHAHGAFHDLFGGSVSQGIVRTCEIPVLLVPATSEPQPVSFFPERSGTGARHATPPT